MNRRDALRVLAAFIGSGAASLAFAGPRVLAVRAWPGKASTRITIESDSELRFFDPGWSVSKRKSEVRCRIQW